MNVLSVGGSVRLVAAMLGLRNVGMVPLIVGAAGADVASFAAELHG